MKMTRLLLITIFLVSSLSQPNTFAQDYTKWGLPEGVTTRLGKGQIRKMACGLRSRALLGFGFMTCVPVTKKNWIC